MPGFTPQARPAASEQSHTTVSLGSALDLKARVGRKTRSALPYTSILSPQPFQPFPTEFCFLLEGSEERIKEGYQEGERCLEHSRAVLNSWGAREGVCRGSLK